MRTVVFSAAAFVASLGVVIAAATAVPFSRDSGSSLERFAAHVGDAAALAAELESDGLTVHLVTEHAVQAVVASGPAGAAQQVADREDVHAVDVLPPAPRDGPFTQKVMDAPDLSGASAIAYVVDTGVELDNPWFDVPGVVVTPGFTYVADNDGSHDCYRHGTAVSSVIGGHNGLVRDVTIVPVSVLCRRYDAEALLAAFDWIALHHPAGVPAVLNMSLSAEGGAAVSEAARSLTDLGIAQFWAAGNEGVDACGGLRKTSYDHVTVVGAARRTRSVETNDGPCVDVYTYGYGVLTAVSSQTARHADVGFATADGGGSVPYTTLSGTSLATPRVASAVLRKLQSDPGLSAQEAVAQLLGRARPGVLRGISDSTPDRFVGVDGARWWYGDIVVSRSQVVPLLDESRYR